MAVGSGTAAYSGAAPIVTFDGDERALQGDIRLDGEDIDVIVGGALVSFDEELAVDGSSIVRVGVLDPYCELEQSGLLDLDRDDSERLRREVELIVDQVAYWLRQVVRSPDDDVIQLVFEDREICRMRDTSGRMKVSARTLDQRGFIRKLCAAAGTPELITTDPTSGERAARERAKLGTYLQVEADRRDRDRRRKPGLATQARYRVKGQWATPEQLTIAARLLSVASEMGAGPKATLALVLAGIVESVLSNPRGGHGNSYGVLQAWVGRSRGAKGTIATIEEAMDVEYMAESFLIDRRGFGFTSKGGAMWQERNNPHLSAGQIAQAVEGSAYPDRYDQYADEGRAIVQAFFGGDMPLATGLNATITTISEADLTVDAGESYWDAARRVADSYNARFFVVANQPYFLYDDPLMRSRPVLTIANPRHPDADRRRTRGVRGIGWEWAPRKQLRRADLLINVRERHAPPGSVVLLDETCGPAGLDPAGGRDSERRGRWLIGRYERDRFGAEARLTLIKGRRPRVPTNVRTEGRSISAASGDLPDGVRVGSMPEIVQRALAEAYRIDAQNLPYAWGGGHGRAGTPSQSTRPGETQIGFDCSGYVGACLAAAGLAYMDAPVPGSGSMATLGEAGEGKWMTIWANAEHVYVVYRVDGGFVRADTGGGPPSGPHIRRGERSNAGFTPRHFAGL